MCAIRVVFLGANLTNDPCVGDVAMAIWRNVMILDGLGGVSAFYALLLGMSIVRADALVEATEFICVE